MSLKTAFFIALAMLLITNSAWLYVFVNQSITYDHTHQEAIYLKKDLELIKSLLVDFSGTIDKVKIIEILKTKYSDHILKEEDGAFFVDGIGLRFENNKLAEVVFMN